MPGTGGQEFRINRGAPSRPLRTGNDFVLVLPDAPRVISLVWDKPEYAPGDACELSVRGKRLEKLKDLTLHVETRAPAEDPEKGWSQVAVLKAEVGTDKDLARASWKLPPPPGEGKGGLLVRAAWDKPRVAPGETLELKLDAKEMEGARIAFEIQRIEPGVGWRKLAFRDAHVEEGQACGTYASPSAEAPGWGPLAGALRAVRIEDDGRLVAGETAWAAAEVAGLEGEAVQFALERREPDGRWQAMGYATSTIRAGRARAGIDLRAVRVREEHMSEQGTQPDPTVRRVQEYRFKVRAADGRELSSAVTWVCFPPELSGPCWNKALFDAGERAALQVVAPERDGGRVRFVVERRAHEGWEAIGAAEAAVEKGIAKVEVDLPRLPVEGLSGETVRYAPSPPEGGKGAQGGTGAEGAGGDEDETPESPAHTHEIRFRAAAKDGSEIVSEPARLRGAPAPGSEPALISAAFAHARYRSGEQALLVVAAGGLEGRPVKLTLERKDGGGWVTAAQLSAPVVDGAARAPWRVPALPLGKPAPEDGKPPSEEQVRFQAEVGFLKLTSEPASLWTEVIRLETPEWSRQAAGGSAVAFEHGEDVGIRVKAPGVADGRMIRFQVEQKIGGDWKPYATVLAPAQSGVAQAHLRLQHPVLPQGTKVEMEALLEAKPVLLRFHCDPE